MSGLLLVVLCALLLDLEDTLLKLHGEGGERGDPRDLRSGRGGPGKGTKRENKDKGKAQHACCFYFDQCLCFAVVAWRCSDRSGLAICSCAVHGMSTPFLTSCGKHHPFIPRLLCMNTSHAALSVCFTLCTLDIYQCFAVALRSHHPG